jgi:hypothetical protein
LTHSTLSRSVAWRGSITVGALRLLRASGCFFVIAQG